MAAAGVACVSQTAGPEAVLAGEARLPFALMGFVTDHAAAGWAPSRRPTRRSRGCSASAGILQRALLASLPRLAAEPGEPAGILFAI